MSLSTSDISMAALTGLHSWIGGLGPLNIVAKVMMKRSVRRNTKCVLCCQVKEMIEAALTKLSITDKLLLNILNPKLW